MAILVGYVGESALESRGALVWFAALEVGRKLGVFVDFRTAGVQWGRLSSETVDEDATLVNRFRCLYSMNVSCANVHCILYKRPLNARNSYQSRIASQANSGIFTRCR